MQNLIIPSTYNPNQIQGSLQVYDQDIHDLSVINYNMDNQIDKYDRNIRDFENSNFRYWDARANFDQIMNNEERRYDYLKDKEQFIIKDINRPFQSIHLYRYKDKFYFKKTEFGKFEIYTKEELEKMKEFSRPIPNISLRQCRELLIRKGRFQEVTSIINSIEDETERLVVENYFNNSQEFERNHHMLGLITTALGISEIEVDDFFLEASEL